MGSDEHADNKHCPVRISQRPRPRGARMTPSASSTKSTNKRDDSGKTRSVPFVVLDLSKRLLRLHGLLVGPVEQRALLHRSRTSGPAPPECALRSGLL